MYARVARWEGADADALSRFADEIKAADSPPPGVPATGFLMLMDREHGRSLGIAFFDTEEDLRAGDAAMNAMSPDTAETGTRVSVEMYEVGAEMRA
jgi:hypothetical protein